MRTLIAFDKFKDSMTAKRACQIAREEISALHFADACPLSDGGEVNCI